MWALFNEANNDARPLNYLNSISDACNDTDIKTIDFFTLNNDPVLERHLSENKIDFIDGFETGDDDNSWWNPRILDDRAARVRVLKLHGSINWFAHKDFALERKGIQKVLNTEKPFLAVQQDEVSYRIEPTVLVGTLNKMLQYSGGVFAVLQYEFFRSLYSSEVLIVCGYGFGDKGINIRIAEWLESGPEKLMIVVHPSEDSRGTSEIAGYWERWKQSGKLRIIQKYIAKLTWQDIKGQIRD